MVKRTTITVDNRMLVLDDVAVHWNGQVAFPRTRWTWRRGEQWAMLGPNGSGKSLLALALCDKVPLQRGEIHFQFEDIKPDAIPEQSIALLSPQVQRDLVSSESSFYQSRWHSGISEGRRTVAQFLSQASVEERNPFEVGGYRATLNGSVKIAGVSAAGFKLRHCSDAGWLSCPTASSARWFSSTPCCDRHGC